MNAKNDDTSESSDILLEENRVTAVVLITLMFVVFSMPSYAADAFLKDVLIADSSVFSNSEVSVVAFATNDPLYGTSLQIAGSQLPSCTLSAGSNNTYSCSDKDSGVQCGANRKSGVTEGTDITLITADTSGNAELAGRIVVAAENRSAGHAAKVRYTDTPGHNASDFVSATTASTSPTSEPQIYTMILAGLGLMGFVAMRRQT